MGVLDTSGHMKEIKGRQLDEFLRALHRLGLDPMVRDVSGNALNAASNVAHKSRNANDAAEIAIKTIREMGFPEQADALASVEPESVLSIVDRRDLFRTGGEALINHQISQHGICVLTRAALNDFCQDLEQRDPHYANDLREAFMTAFEEASKVPPGVNVAPRGGSASLAG